MTFLTIAIERFLTLILRSWAVTLGIIDTAIFTAILLDIISGTAQIVAMLLGCVIAYFVIKRLRIEIRVAELKKRKVELEIEEAELNKKEHGTDTTATQVKK